MFPFICFPLIVVSADIFSVNNAVIIKWCITNRDYFEPLVRRLQMLRFLHNSLLPMRIFLRDRHYIEKGLHQFRAVRYVAAGIQMGENAKLP